MPLWEKDITGRVEDQGSSWKSWVITNQIARMRRWRMTGWVTVSGWDEGRSFFVTHVVSSTTAPAFLPLFLAPHTVRRSPVASEAAHIPRETRGASEARARCLT